MILKYKQFIIENLNNKSLKYLGDSLSKFILDKNNGYSIEFASNGKPSILLQTLIEELGEEQAYTNKAKIYSSEFKNWFGKSVVVDENNEPLIVYHGTNNDFNVFDDKLIGHGSGNYGHYGFGFYCSNDKREAKGYGNIIKLLYLKIENPFYNEDEFIDKLKENDVFGIDDKEISSIDYNSLYNEVKRIDELAARLLELIKDNGYSKGWELFLGEGGKENILELNIIGDLYKMTIKDSYPDYLDYDYGINMDNLEYNYGYKYHQSLHWITDLGNKSKYVTDVIRQLGHDGIIVGSEYVTFKSNQIKSITNNGKFSSNDNIKENHL